MYTKMGKKNLTTIRGCRNEEVIAAAVRKTTIE